MTCSTSPLVDENMAPNLADINGYVNGCMPTPAPPTQEFKACRKRKRDLSIHIDLDSPGASLFSMRPTVPQIDLVHAAFEDATVIGDHYSVSLKKGRWRKEMEDTYSAFSNVNGDTRQAYFGIFDGHCGRRAADFAADHLHHKVVTHSHYRTELKTAIRDAFLKTDEEFLSQACRDQWRDGTTAITAFIRDSRLVVASVGDSKAILVRKGKAIAMSEDHTPDRPDERQRIEAQGGHILCLHKVWRVDGVLAVSRAIGDKDMKKYVSAEPELREVSLTHEDELLILATDGVWNVLDHQQATDIVMKHHSLQDASDALVKAAIDKGSRDNVSALVADLKPFAPRCRKMLQGLSYNIM
eukprot:GILJ01001864.1.p1 GENE.GILJ01001864.1~~GILJ01001864.1.p1  ORF type:complete len:379 (+),score=53.43 GILJ01001864.1:75-1139(+)